jgi:hypothetical protein
MKKVFLYLITILFVLTGCSQDAKLEGYWGWQDSTKANRIILQLGKNEFIRRYAGPFNGPTNPNDFKNGKYFLKKDSLLIITWDDKTIESCRISLLQNGGLILTYGSDQGKFSNQKYIFKKGIDDEEVRKDEIPPEIKIKN